MDHRDIFYLSPKLRETRTRFLFRNRFLFIIIAPVWIFQMLEDKYIVSPDSNAMAGYILSLAALFSLFGWRKIDGTEQNLTSAEWDLRRKNPVHNFIWDVIPLNLTSWYFTGFDSLYSIIFGLLSIWSIIKLFDRAAAPRPGDNPNNRQEPGSDE